MLIVALPTDILQLAGGHSGNTHFNKRYYCTRYPFVSPRGEVIGSGTSAYDIVYSTSGSAENLGFLFTFDVSTIGECQLDVNMSKRCLQVVERHTQLPAARSPVPIGQLDIHRNSTASTISSSRQVVQRQS